MKPLRAMLLALVLVASARTALADPGIEVSRRGVPPSEPGSDHHRRLRVPLVIIENLAMLVPPTLYYWSTTKVQKEDFEMDWDWESWEKKFTSSDAYILDTNDWIANAVRHPIVGALSYQVGRVNGFDPLAATAIDTLFSATWEYLVEYREKISINDMVVNTVSGFMLGEPLFQLGRLANQPGASWARQNLGLLVSPFDRVHTAAGYGSWLAPFRPWTRLEASLGAVSGSYDGATHGDVQLGLDLELVDDRHYGRPGTGTNATRPAMWNRFVADVRFLPTDISSARVGTQTTYFGRYHRDLDADRTGTDHFIGAATGLEYDSRRLAHEWDQLLVLHVIGPRLAIGRWHGTRTLLWEVAAYGDLGMVQAHVFGPDPPFAPMPQTSVLQSRGYYYSGGASVVSRLRLDLDPWFGELEGRAFQMWSIDGHDRVEQDGTATDPHDVSDQRLFGRASLGMRPGTSDVRLEVDLEGAVRRGAWRDKERQTTELSVRGGLVFGF